VNILMLFYFCLKDLLRWHVCLYLLFEIEYAYIIHTPQTTINCAKNVYLLLDLSEVCPRKRRLGGDLPQQLQLRLATFDVSRQFLVGDVRRHFFLLLGSLQQP